MSKINYLTNKIKWIKAPTYYLENIYDDSVYHYLVEEEGSIKNITRFPTTSELIAFNDTLKCQYCDSTVEQHASVKYCFLELRKEIQSLKNIIINNNI